MSFAIFGDADRALLPEGRIAGPMPWVIAIMMFLTVIAAAAGLGLGSAARSLDGGNGIIVQIVSANAERRDGEAGAALGLLENRSEVVSAARVDDREIAAMLEPWLGTAGIAEDIPVPAMIEAELRPGASAADLRPALAGVAPSARIDDNAAWLAPLGKLIAALRWLAAGLVLLMVGATAATVVLAARAALDTHRATIEVLHLMGASDGQVARLFQRRIALDALFGGLIGFTAAAAMLWLIGRRVSALGSELVGAITLPAASWMLLAAMPVAGVLLAMLVARATILRALSRLL